MFRSREGAEREDSHLHRIIQVDLERLDDWDQIRGQCQGTRQCWELSRLTRDPRRNHAPAPNLPGLARALDSSEASGTLQERR
jgi:hypothetical protein